MGKVFAMPFVRTPIWIPQHQTCNTGCCLRNVYNPSTDIFGFLLLLLNTITQSNLEKKRFISAYTLWSQSFMRGS